MLCLNVVLWLQYYVQFVFMFLTRRHEFPFPATRGHLSRGATFAPNQMWPLVAGTTVQYQHQVVGPRRFTNVFDESTINRIRIFDRF